MFVSYFQGSGLNTACRDVDVRVLIDNVTCSLISRSETEIVCDPNEQYPGTSREATLVVMFKQFAFQKPIKYLFCFS